MNKILFDYLPILLFFATYKFVDLYWATGVAMAATALQIAWLKLRGKRVEPMQWVSLGVIVLLGTMTLVLHDEAFIKWKPSVVYWLLGGAIAIGQLVRRNLMQKLLGAQLQLPAPVWNRLAWVWASFFVALGFLNLWVASQFSTDTWVNFKLFGTLGLLLAFILLQGVWLSRHMQQDVPSSPDDSAPKP